MHIYKSAARYATLKINFKKNKSEEYDAAAVWQVAQWRPLQEEWAQRASFFFFIHDSLLSLFQQVPDGSDGEL